MKSNQTTRRDKLRSAIFLSGKTQHDVARECRMSDPYLSETIHGKRNPTESEVASLCEVLGVSRKAVNL